MPRWLTEDPTVVYTLLGFAALLLGYGLLVCLNREESSGRLVQLFAIIGGRRVLWSEHRESTESRQSHLYAKGLAVVFLLIFLVWLIDFLVVTDGEQVVINLKEMAASVKTRDVNRIDSHIAEDFSIQGLNKARFRKAVEWLTQPGQIDEVEVWDFETPILNQGSAFEKELAGFKLNDRLKNAPMIKLEFKGKPKGKAVGENVGFLVRAWFVRDPDGRWRMITFTVSNPTAETSTPITLPLPQ